MLDKILTDQIWKAPALYLSKHSLRKKKTADTADHSKEMLRKLIIIITVQTAPVSNQ